MKLLFRFLCLWLIEFKGKQKLEKLRKLWQPAGCQCSSGCFAHHILREARAKEWANFQQEARARVARLEARDREQEEAIRRRYLFLENDPL